MSSIASYIRHSPLEIEALFKRSTNRKWLTASPMVTWRMTSRDPVKSNS